MLSDMLIENLAKLKNPQKAIDLQRFFKTGKGEYGEGDIFWGLSVPQTRQVIKSMRPDISAIRIENLDAELSPAVTHAVHEVRLAALLILVQLAKKYPQEIADYYLHHTRWINNWDLVDLTADRIVGPTIDPNDLSLLKKLAASTSVRERRIAMMTTFHFIYLGNPEPALIMAEILIHDPHDLIHKASGWMLREVGKRCSQKKLLEFLDQHYQEMPRTMLRYAIERLPEKKRQFYLRKPKSN